MNQARSPFKPSRGLLAAALLAASSLATPLHAQQVFYSGPSNSYGSTSTTPASTYSARDADYERRQQQKEADRRAVKERQRQDSADRLQRARDEHEPYVAKAPVNNGIITDNMNVSAPTLGQVSDSIFATQSAATAQAMARASAPRNVPGMMLVIVGEETYYYGDGVFYIDNGGDLAEVPAPEGALIMKLPSGFRTVTGPDGKRLYVVGETVFERVMVYGKAAFRVVSVPIELAPPTDQPPPLESGSQQPVYRVQ